MAYHDIVELTSSEYEDLLEREEAMILLNAELLAALVEAREHMCEHNDPDYVRVSSYVDEVIKKNKVC